MLHFSKVQCPEYQLGGMDGLEAEVLHATLSNAKTLQITKVLIGQGMDVPKARVDDILQKLYTVVANLLEVEGNVNGE